MKKLLKAIGVMALTGLCVIFLDIGCVFRYTIGIPCFGCGTTRAWVQILQGHLVDAFYWHPLFWLTVPLLIVVMIRQQQVFKSKKLNKLFWITIVAMYVSVYIVRLIMLFPHTPPMDYNYQSLLYGAFSLIRDTFFA